MAQWLGQFTGNNHKTAVLDAHALLQHAAAAFRSASPAEKPGKAKAVRALAKRLHAARTRFLKARLSSAADPSTEQILSDHAREIAKLEHALSALLAGGIEAILNEFSVPDAANPNERT